jgi:hypothetical protein
MIIASLKSFALNWRMSIYTAEVLSFAQTKFRGRLIDMLKVRIVSSDCVHPVSLRCRES